MKYIIVIFSIFFPYKNYSQNIITGKVYDVLNKKPIEFVSVYISNTTQAKTTDKNGEFKIDINLNGRPELVISCVGYETQILYLINNNLEIFLKPKIIDLPDVVLHSSDKNGWKTWGKIFLDNFIGTTEFSKNCKLLNPNSLKFNFNKNKNILNVTSKESLLIHNKSLGYTIKYDLIRFDFDLNNKSNIIEGYTLFEEMTSDRKNQIKKWIKNRENSYYGSMLHFMRSLYKNEIDKEHFEVRKIIKKDNQINFLFNKIIPRDSIVFKLDSLAVVLKFKDILQVVYTNKEPSSFYIRDVNFGLFSRNQISQLSLSENEIKIFENGSYYDGTTLIHSGYWTWSEKVSNLLPLDYLPDVNPKYKN